MRATRRSHQIALLGFLTLAPMMVFAASSVEIAARAGNGWANGTVTIERLDGTQATPVAIGSLVNGHFQAKLPAGRYRIEVQHSDGSAGRQLAPFTLSDGEAQAFYVNLTSE